MCSCWDKGNKPVLLLFAMHRAQRSTENRVAGKPDIVEFYNSTKSGVDNLDKLVDDFWLGRIPVESNSKMNKKTRS